MAIYRLKTSALPKRYRTEQGTETVNDLFGNKLRNEVLLTSYFTALEVEAVAARALKGRLLTREAYRAHSSAASRKTLARAWRYSRFPILFSLTQLIW